MLEPLRNPLVWSGNMSCCYILKGISHMRWYTWYWEAYIKHFLKDFRNVFFPERLALSHKDKGIWNMPCWTQKESCTKKKQKTANKIKCGCQNSCQAGLFSTIWNIKWWIYIHTISKIANKVNMMSKLTIYFLTASLMTN